MAWSERFGPSTEELFGPWNEKDFRLITHRRDQ